MAYKIDIKGKGCPKKVSPCPPVPPPPPISDGEIAALKAQLEQEILKVQEEEKRLMKALSEIDNIALQGSNPDATQTAIMNAISQIDIPTDGIAKQGSNENATLTATQTAALNAASYSDEIKGKLGSPTSGHPSTLFAAVENIQIDDTTLAKQGTNPDTSLTIVDDKIDDFYDTFDSDIASQLRECIGDDESESESEYDNSQSEEELERLRTLQEQLDSLTTSYEELAAGGAAALNTEVETGKELIAQAIEDRGGTATSSMSLAQLAGAINSTPLVVKSDIDSITFNTTQTSDILDLSFINTYEGTSLPFTGLAGIKQIKNLPPCPNLTTAANMFDGCALLESIDLSLLGAPQGITSMASMFYGCQSLQSIDLTPLSVSQGITAINGCFTNTSATTINLQGINTTACSSFAALFRYNLSLRTLNIIGLNASGLTSNTAAQNIFSNGAQVTTFVGGKTYEEVVANDIKTFVGLKFSITSTGFTYATLVDQASWRAVLNGLADATGLGAKTLAIGATNKAKLSADDIVVATNKNWTII